MNKRSLIAVTCCYILLHSYAIAQPARDTSFTTYSAYIKNRKQHPQISIVPELVSKKIRPVKNITYSLNGDRALKADLYIPELNSKQLKAAVILIHGGGWRSGDRSMQAPMAQHLAARGYVAMTPEYRLSTEALYPAALTDVKASVRWLKKNAGRYGIDTGRILLAGCSAGGQLAAWAALTADGLHAGVTDGISSRVAAVIDIDGTLSFVHPETGEGSDRPGKPSAATLWLGASREENEALWAEASPLHQVHPEAPPFLFLNSSVSRMHAGRDSLITRLDAYHIYSEVHTFEDAPHPFWLFEPWFEPMMQYISAFCERVAPAAAGKDRRVSGKKK